MIAPPSAFPLSTPPGLSHRATGVNPAGDAAAFVTQAGSAGGFAGAGLRIHTGTESGVFSRDQYDGIQPKGRGIHGKLRLLCGDWFPFGCKDTPSGESNNK